MTEWVTITDDSEWESVDTPANDDQWETIGPTVEAEEPKKDLSFGEQIYDAAAQTAVFGMTARHMMLDMKRGAEQILAEHDLLGYDEEDTKELAKRQASMMSLLESEEFGDSAMQGYITGALIEPVGLIVPGMKGATFGKAVAKGSAIGATFGGGGYVDEERGQTRLSNMAIGATIGGTIGGALKGASIGVDKLSTYNTQRAATKYVNRIENEYAYLRAQGVDPQEAKTLSRQSMPDGGNGLTNATQLTKRTPIRYMTQVEAKEHLKYVNNPTKAIDHPIANGFDTVLGSLHTRIANISVPVASALRKLELNLKRKPHLIYKDVDKWIESSKIVAKANPTDKAKLDNQLLRGQFDQAVDTMSKYMPRVKASEHIDLVKKHLNKLGDDAVSTGIVKEKIANYFPRIVKDFDGLMEAMGRKEQERILDSIKALESKLKRDLTDVERSDILDKYFRQASLKLRGKPGYSKERKMPDLPPKYQQFYHTPEASLHSYVRNATNDIEKAKFFGKHMKYVKDADGKKTSIMDVDASVESLGAVVGKEFKAGNLTATQLHELKGMLNARFGLGELAPNAVIRNTKNILYASLLGNPLSALTQLGDVGVAMYINGITPTLRAIYKTVTGKSDIKIKDFGLVDALAEEFANTGKTASFMRWSFRWGGFEAMDRFGKSVLINSSLRKLSRWTGTEAKPNKQGLKKLYDKYGEVFGDEYDDLVVALQKGDEMTDNVRLMVWHELSDVQPISLSELPEAYLNNPNLRIAYMFKTFMLKQMDVVRQTAIKKMRSGKKAEGLADMARYMILIGTANAGAQYAKDLAAGKDVEPDITDVATNFLKTFGWSEWTAKTLKEKGPVQAMGEIVLPPVDIWDEIYRNPDEFYQYLPVAGRMVYNIQKNWDL